MDYTIRISVLIITFIITVLFTPYTSAQQQDKEDWAGNRPEGCTVITVGKDASFDGSVINSHTCDSHRTRGWFNIEPPKEHPENSMVTMKKRVNNDTLKMPAYQHIPVGEIPQADKTYGYINTPYPAMNEHQLAVGESTFGGREELKSDEGLLDCQQLNRLIVERCSTARDAIELAGELLKKYGWNDYGEMLSIADTKEVWHLEIIGPGKGKVGAVWAAQRVPDGHISVNGNASTIREIDLDNPDYFMASENVFDVAIENGFWNPEEGAFEFCYAYDPGGRESFSSRRREWRVLSLAAPSLGLHGNAENFPFSVKPDQPVTLELLVRMFQDYYEGTEYEVIKNMTWVNEDSVVEISPLANPFMPYDENKWLKTHGGWGWRGERAIARWFTMYATITQSRDWLPDEVGGIVWLAWDNVASSVYIPIYAGVTDIPESFKTPGRVEGYNRESAWWAFNRMGTLTAQRWGDMRHDVRAVWDPIQEEYFEGQKLIDKKASQLLEEDRSEGRAFLTDYTIKAGNRVVKEAWKLGDFLWTKYDEKF